MISDEVADKGILVKLHHDSGSNIHADFVFIVIDLFEA